MTGLGNAILVGCKWSEWFEFFIFFNPIPLHLIELDWLDLIGLNWVDYQIKSLKNRINFDKTYAKIQNKLS